MFKEQKNNENIDRAKRAFLIGNSAVVDKSGNAEAEASQIARISGRCFAIDRVACQICGDICEPRAIKFFWTSKKVPTPHIQEDACTGCGDCLPVCPPSAITLVSAKAVSND